MRRVEAILMSVVVVIGGLFGFTGCSANPAVCEVNMADIFYSTNGGENYNDGPVTISGGESAILMAVVDIESDDGKEHVVKGELSVSDDQSASVSYLKGQSVTPVSDADGVTYPFEVTTNEKCRLYLEVVPNSVGSVDLELSFDDTLPDKYDVVEKIKVVEKEV